MSTKFFTNEKENTLFNKFEGVFNNNPQLKEFDEFNLNIPRYVDTFEE